MAVTLANWRIVAARRIGIQAPPFAGTDGDLVGLSVVMRKRLVDSMAAVALANPAQFTDAQLTVARSIASKTNYGTDLPPVGEAITFTDAFQDEVKKASASAFPYVAVIVALAVLGLVGYVLVRKA